MKYPVFASVPQLATAYNNMVDKIKGLKLEEISDEDLYVLCLWDTLSVRKNFDAALKVCNSHFATPKDILNYRKLVGTPDPEKFSF